MKNISIALIFIFACSSCSKSSSSSSTPTYGMKATVGGVAFNATNCTTGGGASYYLFSSDGASSSISIKITAGPGSYLVGTYTFDSVNNTAYYYPSSGTFKQARSGSITITSMTPTVSIIGTFNFICSDGTAITNGSFTAHP